MNHDAEMGISEGLIERLEKDRLPRILKIKEHVYQGRALDDAGLGLLQRELQNAQQKQTLVDLLPECRFLFAQVIHLYHDITEKALENEVRGWRPGELLPD